MGQTSAQPRISGQRSAHRDDARRDIKRSSPFVSEPGAVGPAVRVVERAVRRNGPRPGERTELLRAVRTQPAGWPRAAPAARPPVLQRRRGRLDEVDDGVGVDKPVVIASVGAPIEMLAQQPQPEVAGELTRVIEYRTG